MSFPERRWFRFKDKQMPLKQVAAELGADYIVEGAR